MIFSSPVPANTLIVSPSRVELPDLVSAGHGDVEGLVAGELDHVPGAAKAELSWPARRTAAGTCDGPGCRCPRSWSPCLFQIDGADRVVFGVGDVERVAVEAHPLRPIERGFLEVAVVETLLAAADRDRVRPLPGWSG